MKRCLLLIAHGSRRAISNSEVETLAKRLAGHLDNTFDSTRHAFLEIATPSIPQAIDLCVADGAQEIVVLPYFLSPGNHVSRDLPALMEKKCAQYPHIQFDVLEYFGKSSHAVDWLVSHINDDR